MINGAAKVVLHPSVAGTKPRVFNVALIFLKEPVEFTKFISPVCLRSSDETPEVILGKTAFAVGYGVDKVGSISLHKRHMPMVVLDDATCQKFYSQTLKKRGAGAFFCARGNGIDTPCRYDKPLYIKSDDRWFLQAMSSTFKSKHGVCRPRAPVLYEDISDVNTFTNWIESEIKAA